MRLPSHIDDLIADAVAEATRVSEDLVLQDAFHVGIAMNDFRQCLRFVRGMMNVRQYWLEHGPQSWSRDALLEVTQIAPECACGAMKDLYRALNELETPQVC